MSNTKTALVLFLTFTLILSAVFWVLIIRAGTISAQRGLYTLGLMWCPGIAAILTLRLCRGAGLRLGWHPGPWRYLVLGYGLPLLYAGFPYALLWGLGVVPLTTASIPPGQSVAVFVAQRATVLFVVSMLSATGEEIGWRGLLVPALARLTTPRWVALISGGIWALWHLPLILLADYHGQTPIPFALLCFTVGIIGLSVAFARLRLASRSLWPAAVLHASHNLFIQNVFDPLSATTSLSPYLIGEFGVVMLLAGVGMALFAPRLIPLPVEA